MGTNLVATASLVSAAERMARNGHRGGVFWLTGLPASGKTTLALNVERRLFDLGWQVRVLDGDDLRNRLNADLGFSPRDRAENIRRAAAVASLFAQTGMVTIAAFVSPYEADRAEAKRVCGPGFHEIHVRSSLAACELRDPKGHYRRARNNEIASYTGVSAPYEAPAAPDLLIDTEDLDIERAAARLFEFILQRCGQAAAG